MSFTVEIVGRPNVGKSTFFNRMLEERKAIVDDVSGVTRDRQYGIADWNGKSFNVIDTGGFLTKRQKVFYREICKNTFIFFGERATPLFLVIVWSGLITYHKPLSKRLGQTL